MPISGNFSGLGKLSQNLAKLAEVPSQASREAATDIKAAIEEQFDQGQDPYGRPWAPLAPATLARGRRAPPLTDTGAMRDGLSVEPKAGSGIEVKFAQEEPAIFHQKGTKNMPAREILPEARLPEPWEHAIDEAIENAVEKRMKAL